MKIAEAKKVPIDTLHEDPANVRKHGDRNRSAVRASLQEFGQVEPLVVESGTGRVLGGNCRLAELRALGIPEVLVVEIDVHGVDATRLALALNQTAVLAEWDDEGLAAILRSLAEEGLDAPGFDEEELAKLLKDGAPPVVEEDDDVPLPVPAVPVSRQGEVYELGPHRLVCGDSTEAEAWLAMRGGQSPSCIVTDPPYGMSYKGRTFGKQGLANDGEKEFEQVMSAALAAASREAPNACAAVCFGASRLDAYFRALAPLMAFQRLLVIYKPNGMAHPWRGWIMTSEVIGLWTVGEPEWPQAQNHCHDVYTFDYSERPEREVDHPTVKPLTIIADLVNKLSLRGAVVLDPFGGSGTTLIACAQTGRVARLIELDPGYCDVIRRRWTRWAKANNQDPGPGRLDDNG